MKEYNIVIPRYDWLIGAKPIWGDYNRYYGSIGTDPAKGCFDQKIFNYTIWLEMKKIETLVPLADGEEVEDVVLNENGEKCKKEEKEVEVMKAAVYPGMNSFKNTPESEITSVEFPSEEESRAKIEQWLQEQANDFFGE